MRIVDEMNANSMALELDLWMICYDFVGVGKRCKWGEHSKEGAGDIGGPKEADGREPSVGIDRKNKETNAGLFQG